MDVNITPLRLLESKDDNNRVNENSVETLGDKFLMSQLVVDKDYLTKSSTTKPSESKQQSLNSTECPWDRYPIATPRSQSASASASGIHCITTLQKLATMREKSSWLTSNDYDTIMNISREIDNDKNLPDAKLKIIDRIYVRFILNQQPKIFRGGSPGSKRGGR